MDNVAPILSPNTDLMVKHLQFLFGRALSGRIEVTAIHTDKASEPRPRTRFFDLEEIESAADFAAEINSQPNWNVYVGAALRKPETFPGHAADDNDFLATYALWADADDEAQLMSARAHYDPLGVAPPFVVVTGRTPTKRAQLWWPLDTQISDLVQLRSALRGIASALGTDPKVCTGKQLMRLAGGLAWPKLNKPGRALELIEIIEPSRAPRVFPAEQIARAFPPVEVVIANTSAEITVEPAGVLGLGEKIIDGREAYAFRLIRATLRQWIGENGCEPTLAELLNEVSAVFYRRVDSHRPGREPAWLKQKCVEALTAFRRGMIPGMRGLDEAVETWAERGRAAADAEEEAGPERPMFDLRAWTARAYRGDAKPIEWLCEGTIPLGAPVLFASMGGLGKSFMAIDLGLEIAVGVVSRVKRRSVLGGPVVQSGSAVILSAEDGRESIHRRLEKIDPERRRDQNPDRLIIVPLPDIGGPKPLVANNGKTLATTAAFNALRRELAEIPDLKLVVIDPLQAFVIADINADPAAGQFMWSAFAALCASTGATVIVAHHMRKEGASSITTAEQAREAIRGSTALVDGARLTYALWKAGGEEGRDMCARLDVDYAPERIAFGAVVKANDEASRDIQTYVRQESGLLTDATDRASIISEVRAVTPRVAQEIVTEIGQAWNEAKEGCGEGYAQSIQSGERAAFKLVMRRSGCTAKEAKDWIETWIANGILQSQLVDPKRHRMALRQVGRLG